MQQWKRWRWWAVLALPVAVIIINSFGPDEWRDPFVKLLALSWSAVCIALAHSGRKALFDYAHGREAWLKSLEHPIGAGLSFLGLCFVAAMLFFGMVSIARAAPPDPTTFVPPACQQLAPIAHQEIEQTWPGMPRRSYLGALVEKESCIHLRHRNCCSTAARLKTSREEGAGLTQFTRAWGPDGRERFDALAEVKTLAPVALADLNWQTVYTRSDLGLRAALVKVKDCDTRLRRLGNFGWLDRVAFCDAAYNGGFGGLAQDRRLCGLTPGCDPGQWFGHVERTSNKSRTPWQGYGQSSYEINRAHVRATVIERRPKYVPWLGV